MNQQHVNLKLRQVAKISIFIQFMSQNSDSNIRIQLSHSASTCQCPDTKQRRSVHGNMQTKMEYADIDSHYIFKPITVEILSIFQFVNS